MPNSLKYFFLISWLSTTMTASLKSQIDMVELFFILENMIMHLKYLWHDFQWPTSLRFGSCVNSKLTTNSKIFPNCCFFLFSSLIYEDLTSSFGRLCNVTIETQWNIYPRITKLWRALKNVQLLWAWALFIWTGFKLGSFGALFQHPYKTSPEKGMIKKCFVS